jgi:excinuclease UvrABC nuclease subunit
MDHSDEIPQLTTDLYRLYDAEGTLLYVGISKSAMTRMKQHAKEKHWWLEVCRIEIEHVLGGRSDAEIVERRAIETERPKYNVMYNSPRYLPLPVKQEPLTKAQMAERAQEQLEHLVDFQSRKREQILRINADIKREHSRARDAQLQAEHLEKEREGLSQLIDRVSAQITAAREELLALL